MGNIQGGVGERKKGGPVLNGRRRKTEQRCKNKREKKVVTRRARRK